MHMNNYLKRVKTYKIEITVLLLLDDVFNETLPISLGDTHLRKN